MWRREQTSITIGDKELAERFRDERDERGLTSDGMLRKLLDRYDT